MRHPNGGHFALALGGIEVQQMVEIKCIPCEPPPVPKPLQSCSTPLTVVKFGVWRPKYGNSRPQNAPYVGKVPGSKFLHHSGKCVFGVTKPPDLTIALFTFLVLLESGVGDGQLAGWAAVGSS